jgi:hypothetical protein
MDTLLSRLTDIEAVLDAGPDSTTGSRQTVFKSLQTLQSLIDGHIESNPGLTKLLTGLDKSSLKYATSNDEDTGEDAVEYRRNLILAETDKITQIIQSLSKIKSLEKHYQIPVIDIDKEKYITEVNNLQLRYNYLLIRSINLLQNYLNLNENMNNRVRYNK